MTLIEASPPVRRKAVNASSNTMEQEGNPSRAESSPSRNTAATSTETRSTHVESFLTPNLQNAGFGTIAPCPALMECPVVRLRPRTDRLQFLAEPVAPHPNSARNGPDHGCIEEDEDLALTTFILATPSEIGMVSRESSFTVDHDDCSLGELLHDSPDAHSSWDRLRATSESTFRPIQGHSVDSDDDESVNDQDDMDVMMPSSGGFRLQPRFVRSSWNASQTKAAYPSIECDAAFFRP